MERTVSGVSTASGASWVTPAQPRTFLTQGRTDALEAARPSLALLEQQVSVVARWARGPGHWCNCTVARTTTNTSNTTTNTTNTPPPPLHPASH